MDYVDRIILSLKKEGKTQKGLSLAITKGKDSTAANKIIKRIRKMQDDEFLPAADYLEVSPGWLLAGQEENKNENVPNYGDLITRLILEGAIKGGNSTKILGEECERIIGEMVTDDMLRGMEIDVERYRRIIENIKKKKS